MPRDIATHIKRGKFWLRLDRPAPRRMTMLEQEQWRQREHARYLAEYRAIYEPTIAIYRKQDNGSYGDLPITKAEE